jgi:hypothetical protein
VPDAADPPAIPIPAAWHGPSALRRLGLDRSQCLYWARWRKIASLAKQETVRPGAALAEQRGRLTTGAAHGGTIGPRSARAWRTEESCRGDRSLASAHQRDLDKICGRSGILAAAPSGRLRLVAIVCHLRHRHRRVTSAALTLRLTVIVYFS